MKSNWSSTHKRRYDDIEYFNEPHIEGVGLVKPRKRNWRLFRIVIMVGLLLILLGIRFI